MNEGHNQFCKLPPKYSSWIWGLTNGCTSILRGINFPRQVEDHDPPEMAIWSKVCCLSLPNQRNCPWHPMLQRGISGNSPTTSRAGLLWALRFSFPESPLGLNKSKKKILVVIFWDNSITAFVSFWGLPNQTAHPQTNLQLENVVKKEIPRTTQGMKEKQSGTSFDSNHISLVITVRIKLQTLITGLSTKVFRITARTSFRNGSAAQARDRIHGTVCMTSQLAVNFN